MLEIIASISATYHAIFNIFRKDKHQIVLIYTPGVECVAIECSCGKVFYSGLQGKENEFK